MSLYRVNGYHVTLSEGHMIANHPIYGVIGYHVTLSESHMIANHPYKETLVPHLVATLIYFSQIYSYYIRGDRSPLSKVVIIPTITKTQNIRLFFKNISLQTMKKLWNVAIKGGAGLFSLNAS